MRIARKLPNLFLPSITKFSISFDSSNGMTSFKKHQTANKIVLYCVNSCGQAIFTLFVIVQTKLYNLFWYSLYLPETRTLLSSSKILPCRKMADFSDWVGQVILGILSGLTSKCFLNPGYRGMWIWKEMACAERSWFWSNLKHLTLHVWDRILQSPEAQFPGLIYLYVHSTTFVCTDCKNSYPNLA